jgi:hypothetical protein
VTDKESYISTALYSDDSQLKFFQGKNFDGSVMGEVGTSYNDAYTRIMGFAAYRYPDEESKIVNDNINSFLYATSSVELNSCSDAMYFD